MKMLLHVHTFQQCLHVPCIVYHSVTNYRTQHKIDQSGQEKQTTKFTAN